MTLKIAIVGGGIGGLAAAAFLNQAGLPATVYEQARELREIGAGLVVAPNMARLLRRLGVLDRLLKTAVRLETGWEFRRWRAAPCCRPRTWPPGASGSTGSTPTPPTGPTCSTRSRLPSPATR